MTPFDASVEYVRSAAPTTASSSDFVDSLLLSSLSLSSMDWIIGLDSAFASGGVGGRGAGIECGLTVSAPGPGDGDILGGGLTGEAGRRIWARTCALGRTPGEGADDGKTLGLAEVTSSGRGTLSAVDPERTCRVAADPADDVLRIALAKLDRDGDMLCAMMAAWLSLSGMPRPGVLGGTTSSGMEVELGLPTMVRCALDGSCRSWSCRAEGRPGDLERVLALDADADAADPVMDELRRVLGMGTGSVAWSSLVVEGRSASVGRGPKLRSRAGREAGGGLGESRVIVGSPGSMAREPGE